MTASATRTAANVTATRTEAGATDTGRCRVQTQWPTLVVAPLLVAAAPRTFGIRWGDSGRHLRAVSASLVGVAAVVAVFRAVGGNVPWSGWEIWVAVPVTEELLFRGFAPTALLWALRHGFEDAMAVRAAVAVSAVVWHSESLRDGSESGRGASPPRCSPMG